MVDGSLRDRHLAQPPCVLEQRGHSVLSLGLQGIYTQPYSKIDLERGGSDLQNTHEKLNTVVCICKPSVGKTEMGNPWNSLISQPS